MAKTLESVRVLVVEDDADTGDLLAMALSDRGATVRVACTGSIAMDMLGEFTPDVLLCDLGLPDVSGLDWLAKVRVMPSVAAVPAIAISGHASATDRERSLAAGFEKHLNKPAPLQDILVAITIIARRNGTTGLQAMLYRLALVTGCRYTSLLRFDADTLVSVWTYDRTQPGVDPFPLDMPIEASYCDLVKRTGALVAIENAATDPRVDGHPKQHVLATYLGVPVFAADGGMFGTLCSYDAEPHVLDECARAAVTAAAHEIEATMRGSSRELAPVWRDAAYP